MPPPHYYSVKAHPAQPPLMSLILLSHLLVAVGSTGILKAKQKVGVTFNFGKQDIIDFTKFSKMTMCRASLPQKQIKKSSHGSFVLGAKKL